MITVDTAGHLTTITLNRPDKANALNEDMFIALIDAVKGCAGQHALILTGAGKVFSAGMDLEAAKSGLATSPLWEELSSAIAALPCLTIAALNGTLAGGSFGMALACDMRVAVPEAKLFYPVMKLGFLPQPSDPKRLRALVGPARAKRILMAGEKLLADDALAIGLVDQLVPRNDLIATAQALTTDAQAADIAHVSAIKAMI